MKKAVEEVVICDAYTLFFEPMYQSFFEGENEKIPFSTVSPGFLRNLS